MYRASGMNEYRRSGEMPQELVDYLKKKYRRGGMVYAQDSNVAPVATSEQEEILNFLLNPESGFQEGQKGKYGSLSMYEPLPTYEEFFRKEKGYYPTVGSIPRTREGGSFSLSDLKGTDRNVFYTDIADVGDTSGLFAGYIDRGGTRGGAPGASRFERAEDVRTVDINDPTYKGFQFIDKRTGTPELREAVRTADDVAEMNKKYADFMKTVEMQPERQGVRYVKTPTGFIKVGPQSQL